MVGVEDTTDTGRETFDVAMGGGGGGKSLSPLPEKLSFDTIVRGWITVTFGLTGEDDVEDDAVSYRVFGGRDGWGWGSSKLENEASEPLRIDEADWPE